jgi:hypothetical protein
MNAHTTTDPTVKSALLAIRHQLRRLLFRDPRLEWQELDLIATELRGMADIVADRTARERLRHRR